MRVNKRKMLRAKLVQRLGRTVDLVDDPGDKGQMAIAQALTQYPQLVPAVAQFVKTRIEEYNKTLEGASERLAQP